MTIWFRSSLRLARSVLPCADLAKTTTLRLTRRTRRLRSRSPVTIAWKWARTRIARSSAFARATARPMAVARAMNGAADKEPLLAAQTRCTQISKSLTRPMISIPGPRAAITATIFRARRNICRAMWSALTISMTTAIGATIPVTDTSGFPTEWKADGRLITLATGFGFLRGDGLGWMILRGAMLHSTTDVG